MAALSFAFVVLCASSVATIAALKVPLDITTAAYNKVQALLDVKATDFTAKYGTQEWAKGDFKGSAVWCDEMRGGKLTGVSKYYMEGKGQQLASLQVWLGPGYTVPNLMVTLLSKASGVCNVKLDYMARGSGPLGSDATYLDTYYGKESIAFYDKYSAMAKPSPLTPSFSGRLIRSPLSLELEDVAIDTVEAMVAEHTDRWCSFMADAKQVESRLRGAINTRDDKLRQFAYSALVKEAALFTGADATFCGDLGASHCGPVAEAYVGGGG